MKAKIHILATGGTIAAQASSSCAMTGYTASNINIQDLINAIPDLLEFATISGEQISNVLSHCLTFDIWLKLARRVNELLTRDDVDGIVITHGTNTMEETAYFLNLTVNSQKPVILTGAMRPATALSAEGPLNLLNAVRLAASPEAYGQGVLVMLNEKINASRDVTKTNTMAVETFQAHELGYLGYMQEGRPYFFRSSTRRHTTQSEFNINAIDLFPRVDIIYCYINDDRVLIDAAVQAGAKGIVVAATGHGMISDNMKEGLIAAEENGLVIVRATRCPFGMVTPLIEDRHFIAAGSLNPQKARILLMLGLQFAKNKQDLERIFTEY